MKSEGARIVVSERPDLGAAANCIAKIMFDKNGIKRAVGKPVDMQIVR